jgi:hypothetical protein
MHRTNVAGGNVGREREAVARERVKSELQQTLASSASMGRGMKRPFESKTRRKFSCVLGIEMTSMNPVGNVVSVRARPSTST